MIIRKGYQTKRQFYERKIEIEGSEFGAKGACDLERMSIFIMQNQFTSPETGDKSKMLGREANYAEPVYKQVNKFFR